MPEMKILSSREEWLKERKNRIGGSDAAAIVGMNPYMTNVDLWEIKTGLTMQQDISHEPYVEYGTRAEEPLRRLFELDYPEYQVGYAENNLFLSDEVPFAHASLDGWLIDQKGRRGIWECKTSNIVSASSAAKWKDKIPDNYYCQICHYLMVTGWDFVILKAQLKYDYPEEDIMLRTLHYRFERADMEQDIQYLREKEKEFWDHVQNGKKPFLILPGI